MRFVLKAVFLSDIITTFVYDSNANIQIYSEYIMTAINDTLCDIEMKIEITNHCLHGRCKFCSPLFRPTVKEAEVKTFLKRLEQHIDDYLRNGGRRILLTGGGEPIDAPAKLFGALQLIARKKVELGIELELLTVYTNGVKLLKKILPDASETYVGALVRLGVRDINLSVHGSTLEERTYTSGKHMGRLDVNDLISTLIRRGIRVMTRTTLAKGGIDSMEKIDAFACQMDELGVHIAYFSDLFHVPIRNDQTTPGSKTVLGWTDDHRVDFDGILENLMQSESFELLSEYTRHNNQGRTFEFRHRDHSLRIMLGDLVIGNESADEPTYAYIKSDGSMDIHNNVRDGSARQHVSASNTKSYLKTYRPGRDDL